MRQLPFQKGFTLLEILLVLGIIGVLLAVVLPPFNNFRQTSILNSETQQVLTLINKARMSASSSKDDQQFGVHFEAGKIVIYQGVTYVAGAATNEVRVLDPAITANTIVNGGGSEVLFEKIIGSTSQNATTTLLVAGTTASTTVLIRTSGVVTLN